MYPIHPDLAKINSFQSCIVPRARELYQRFGYKATNFIESEEVINLNDRGKLSDLRAAQALEDNALYREYSEQMAAESNVVAAVTDPSTSE